MQKFTTLADAIRLAELAHFNQTDKAGLPYIEHPRRVMKAVQTQGAMPYVQMAAILHDVTEDTAFTCDMLLTLGVPAAAVEIIKLVDRDYSEEKHSQAIISCSLFDKEDWNIDMEHAWSMSVDEFYYFNIKNNAGARQVKLADIGDNLQPWRLNYLPAEKQRQLQEKYAKALSMLNS